MATATKAQRRILNMLNLGDRLSSLHGPDGAAPDRWTVIDRHGLAVYDVDARTARVLVREGWVEEDENHSDAHRTRYRITDAGRRQWEGGGRR